MHLLSWRQCGETATNVNINLFMILAWLWASGQIYLNSLLQSVSLWPLDMQAEEPSSFFQWWHHVLIYIQADG